MRGLKKTKPKSLLQESERRFRGIIETTQAGYFFIDKQGCFQNVNDAWLRMHKYTSPDEVIGRHFSLTQIDHDLETASTIVRGLLEGNPVPSGEFARRCKDGSVGYHSFTINPVLQGGQIAGLEGFIIDATDSKIAEERIERFGRIFEDSLNEIYLFDSETLKFTQVNKTAQHNLGYTMDEFKQMTPLDLKPEFTSESFEKMIAPLRTGEKKKLVFETVHKRKDHSLYDVEVHLQLLQYGHESIFAAIILNITERKQAEAALQASEEKYRSMMEAMKDAVYICTLEFQVEYMNPRMIRLVGRDATGETCYSALYGGKEQCPWCVLDRIQSGEHVEYELAPPRNNLYYSITNSPIYHVDGSISKLSILRDITEHKAIESQLRQARKMESIGTLAGGIAHDFNNILFMITGNAELALMDIPEWNPVQANLKEIKSASLRAAGIVKQLLNFSRKTEQELKPVGAVTVIKDALYFLRSTLPSTIELQKHLPDREITISADPIQINQILMNICTNAAQAMGESGGVLDIMVESESLTEHDAGSHADLIPGNYLKITVRDTGPGIDPEILDRIFDPYFTTKEVGKGSGMGLATVLGIVKNHNGVITADSAPGKGTTFTMRFPAVDENPLKETTTWDDIPAGSETILFVDDEKTIVQMIVQVLKRLGYQVETRTKAADAFALFQSRPNDFDLMITDMTMPQLTGVKLSEKLKQVRPDIPIIICTGHSELIDEEKSKALGIDAYIMKPILTDDIAKTIRQVLDGKNEN